MPKNQVFLLMGVMVALVMSACSGTRKFDYASAYKFKHISHNTQRLMPQEEAPKDNALLTSNSEQVNTNNELQENIESATGKLIKLTGLESDQKELNRGKVETALASMSASEKRALRKEIKGELKSIKASHSKNNLDIKEMNSPSQLTGYTRLGVIFGGIGIILLILETLFAAGGVLGLFGVLLILAGVVFILVDVV
ncbi:MAG: hypothetical protein JJU28_22525 [Cyclobacteriaceae bacterium]|nr:hypothetical protein [Cyclobacteriaceae bacterium]